MGGNTPSYNFSDANRCEKHKKAILALDELDHAEKDTRRATAADELDVTTTVLFLESDFTQSWRVLMLANGL